MGFDLSHPPSGEITESVAFRGDVDVKIILSAIPKDQRLKGMFFGRFVADLGADWEAVAKRLVAPPKLGKYVPFFDYPLVDHADLSFTCARRRFPGISLREAVRRLARDDMKTFLGSTFGRVTAAIATTPEQALLAVPDAYRRVVVGPRYTAEARGPRRVTLELVDAFGLWEYQVGQLEGIVRHYGEVPRVRCSKSASGARVYDVEW
jgi:uncharacterized protein (TIGR02265 family)